MHKYGKEVAIVNQDDNLYKYYNFDKLKNFLLNVNNPAHTKPMKKFR